MATKTSTMRVFHGSYAEAWNLLQLFDATASNNIPDHKAFYLNSLYCILIQIEYEPKNRNSMLQSLIDFAHGAKNVSSLETVFLTLLNHARTQQHGSHNPLFQRGLKAWMRFANSKQPVDGASPMGFYNVNSKKMFLFSTETADAIRAGQIDLSSRHDMSKTLEDEAKYEVTGAFSHATADQGILLFRQVGEPDLQSVVPTPVLVGVAVLVGLAILLYASTAELLPNEQGLKEPDEGIVNVAAVPIIIGSLQNNDKFEKMVDALKELDSTATELPGEKEVKGTGLVMDRDGRVNISVDNSNSSV